MLETTTRIRLSAPPLPYFLECGRSEFAPGDLHPTRQGLAVFDWLFVVSGKLVMGEEERAWEVPAGHLLLLLPERYHYPVRACEEATVFYWIHFDCPGFWEELDGEAVVERDRRGGEAPGWQGWFAPRSLSLPRSGPIPFAEETFRALAQLYESSSQGRFVAFWPDQQRFIELLQLMEAAPRAGGSPQAWQVAERTEAFLKRHYADSVTNRMLSDALHFHENYITRCMKETHGCTPLEYLLRYRIEQAKLQLLKTDAPIGAIAERVGFSSAPYFSNCFRREVGLSPMQFRRRFARENPTGD
ncbi:AraC family transcriptional regulator [Paenibacillus sp. TRM 82003]|nr:AraC family transcriptional regulator [Paenibacillus sp. TRM 82003]